MIYAKQPQILRIPNIYLTELELKKKTESNSNFSDLDLKLNIVDQKCTTAVFDKRDGFNSIRLIQNTPATHVLRTPHLQGLEEDNIKCDSSHTILQIEMALFASTT